MLHAYMDDSGSHRESHACIVAGYFGGVNRWKEFEERWGRVLNKFGVEEFHSRLFWKRTDAGQGVGQYRKWSPERLEQFLDELLVVIEDTEIYPFACGILREDWDLLTEREKKVLSGGIPPRLEQAPANAMFFPFQFAIARIVQYCKPGKKMQFFFDNNEHTNIWASLCYARLKQTAIEGRAPHFAARMNGITFADSRDALPLQAADLLAYEAHRYTKAARGDKRFPVSPVYGRALKRIKDKEDFRLFDRGRLQDFIPRRLDHRDR